MGGGGGGGGFGGTKGAGGGGKTKDSRGKTVGEILSDATTGRKTKGKTTQYEKSSGFEQANKDFEALDPSEEKEIDTPYGQGKTGELPDGRTVVVRPGSSDGRPTVEVRYPNGRGIEIRYGK